MNAQRAKVGFVFSTKDRVEFTRRSLRNIDTEGGFDLVWVDGSDTPEGRALPGKVRLSNCRLAEVHYDIRGGPDNAIRFGLQRLLELGYDYCGLIENDIEFKPGWFTKLMELFSLGEQDGLNVGAVTVRTIPTWVLMYKPQYALMWNTGAGMVLFKREAAEIVLDTYGPTSMYELRKFYLQEFGIDLVKPYLGRLSFDVMRMWEVYTANTPLGCDWAYSMQLYKEGFSTIGTTISFASNMDVYGKLIGRIMQDRREPFSYLGRPDLFIKTLSHRILNGIRFWRSWHGEQG